MKDPGRVYEIDLLRAIAILGVMVTHSLALFLGTAATDTAWNYLHFVVVAFVGCSGYVTWLSFQSRRNKRPDISWYVKRFMRLYIPYAVYVAAYTLLAWVFPAFISGRGIAFTTPFFIRSIFLTGGADIGWLPLLFLQFMLLTPVYFRILGNRYRYFGALLVTGVFVLVTTFLRIPASFSRAVAWFPWSFIFLLGAGLAKSANERKNPVGKYLIVIPIGAVVWILLRSLLLSQEALLTLTLHKYPPDLFYLSYGIVASCVLLLLAKTGARVTEPMSPLFTFMSKHAYGMFFLHLIALDFITTSFRGISVGETTLLSLFLTITATWLWDRIPSFFGEA